MASMRCGWMSAGAALGAAVLCAAAARACDVPVFRYALERWEPSLYEVLIFHRGELAPEQKKVADWLTKCAAGQEPPCNMDVRTVDVDGNMPPVVAELWKSQKAPALPWVVACYPLRYGPPVPAWTGLLTAENARALVDSPARREVARRIVQGDSAVWVLLESGNAEKDDAAAKLLAGELKELEKTLELPVPQGAMFPGAEPDDAPPAPALKIAFSVVRVSRKDLAERAFLQMLLNTEEDLRTQYASEPMAFTFFGRGRAMLALVGKGINKGNIGEVCEFLIGQCSCLVKEQNPGLDVLFSADWSAAFEEQEYTAPPLPDLIAPAAAESSPAPAEPDDSAPSAQARVEAERGGGLLLRTTLIALACVVLVTAVLVVWVSRRPSRG